MEDKKVSPMQGIIISKKAVISDNTSRIYSKKKETETVIGEVESTNIDYVKWGEDNNLPQTVLGHISSDEILHRSSEFNKSMHVGGGLIYYKEVISNGVKHVEIFEDPEIEDWLEENQHDYLWKKCVENYEDLGNPIPENILSNDRKKIARLFIKDSSECRWEKKNKKTREVENMYLHECWSEYKKGEEVKIETLNSKFPLQDLTNRTSGSNFIFRIPPIASGRKYYEPNNAEVLINAGVLDIHRDYKRTIKSILKNQSTALWHVELYEQYFIAKYGAVAWNKMSDDPKERALAMVAFRDMIDEYITGAENAGKLIITGSVYDRQGKPLPGVTIKPLQSSMKDGMWVPDQQLAANSIYQGMGVDASSVGGFSNQNRTMNSGSEKLNSFWNSEATLYTERLITFMPFYFVARYNGWTSRHKRFRWGVGEMNNNIQQNNSNQLSSNQPAQ